MAGSSEHGNERCFFEMREISRLPEELLAP